VARSALSANSGVSEPRALLGVPANLDDRVIDIEQRIPDVVIGGAGWTGRQT